MERSQKIGVLIAILCGLSLMFSSVIYNSGASGLIIGTYAVIMFVVLSALVVKMILQLNGKKSMNESGH